MTTKRAKEVIKEFISSPEPDVLVLKGRWGTGKTYAWLQLIKTIASQGRVGKPRYAYVSLFGLTSLEQLKSAIFEQSVAVTEIAAGASISTLTSNIEMALRGELVTPKRTALGQSICEKVRSTSKIVPRWVKQAMPYAAHIPYLKDYLPFIHTASYLFLRDMLICLDDFERKGDSLAVKEILGLTSMLKEQRNCKIAIILNDESLQGDAQEEYHRYREKVVDIEIDFKPSPQECADLVFTPELPYQAIVGVSVSRLGIRNIRVLQKINRLIDGIGAELVQYEKEVSNQVTQSLTLFAWSFYSREGDAPPLNYIENLGFKHYGLGQDQSQISEQEKKWNALLRDYDYTSTDELDSELIDYVRKGFYSPDTLNVKLSKLNERVLASKGGNSVIDAWRLFHDSFDDNEPEVVELLSQRYRAAVMYVSPSNLNALALLLRELGHSNLASELIENYVTKRSFSPGLFDLDSSPFRGEITDPEMRKRFAEVVEETLQPRKLADVVTDLSAKNGWCPADEDAMEKATLDEYYAFFKSQHSSDLSKYVDTCLRFGRFQNATDRQKRIADLAAKALRRIAKESKLNEIRVRRYGIRQED